jgi:hypothetical protein
MIRLVRIISEDDRMNTEGLPVKPPFRLKIMSTGTWVLCPRRVIDGFGFRSF